MTDYETEYGDLSGTVDGYRLYRTIGKGAFGKVKIGVIDGETHAVKLLKVPRSEKEL